MYSELTFSHQIIFSNIILNEMLVHQMMLNILLELISVKFI